MTDTATPLTPYRGRDVASTSIRITNAGDGLSQGMAIDPVELEPGSTHYVVLEVKVDKHTHKPLPKTELLTLEQVLKAGTATLVDPELVAHLLAEQAAKIEEARRAKELAAEAAKGTRRLLSDDEVAALQAEHDEGKHDGELGLREGCPGCDERLAEQAALREAEAGAATPIGRARGAKKRAR